MTVFEMQSWHNEHSVNRIQKPQSQQVQEQNTINVSMQRWRLQAENLVENCLSNFEHIALWKRQVQE